MGKSAKRTIWIIIPAILAVILTILIYRGVTIGNSYRLELENTYARSLGDLTEYLEDLENVLNKAQYVSTATGQESVGAKLQEAGGGAKAAMSYLPFSEDKGGQIEKSISVISDFGLYLGRKSAAGEVFTPEDYEMLATLAEHVTKIKNSFSEIRNQVSQGELSVGKTQEFLSKTINLPAAPGFDDGLSDLSEELSALPTMLYDGPFSDHIENREPEMLKGGIAITEAEALQKASKFLGEDTNTLRVKIVSEGPLGAFEIEGEDQVVRVTKIGGEISFFKKDLDVEDTKLSYEEALKRAHEELKKAGYENMKESYYVINDNTCTINFAPQQEGVILYPDLIKVTIELNEGGMVEFSSTGYLMNHHTREELIPKLDEKTAANSLNGNLKIENIAIAVIPTPGEKEVLAYEFTCKAQTEEEAGKEKKAEEGTEENTEEVIVYINGTTGLEEQIYVLTNSENGRLVS